jgi:hypothetical protein
MDSQIRSLKELSLSSRNLTYPIDMQEAREKGIRVHYTIWARSVNFMARAVNF